jgi:glycosyltransferase involved in cell wall biosynthesis
VTAATQVPFPPRNYDVCTQARPISICHIASGDTWGGAEAQVATLVTELANRSGVEVCAIILNPGRLADELLRAGVNVTVVPESKTSFFQLLAKSVQVVTAARAEIIHSHRYKENLIATLLGMRDPRLRLIRTQHGHPERFAGLHGMKQRTVYALDRITARYGTDRVISVSSQLRTYLETYMPGQKISIVSNGVSLRQTSKLSRAEAKKKFHLGNLAVGFIGRLEQVKRPDLFIETARHLAQYIPGIQFVIAGSGQQEPFLRQLARSSGIAPQIEFLGHCSETDELLRGLDLLLIPSDTEGLPMVLLEAMAAGTPVVARAVGGIPEVITHGETGWLVENSDPATLAETCARVLCDRTTQHRVTSAARALVEARFSAACNAEQMLKLYRSLTSNNTVPA